MLLSSILYRHGPHRSAWTSWQRHEVTLTLRVKGSLDYFPNKQLSHVGRVVEIPSTCNFCKTRIETCPKQRCQNLCCGELRERWNKHTSRWITGQRFSRKSDINFVCTSLDVVYRSRGP